ncbi:MAG: hypothetical protein JNM63_08260 [Spirochaetia bacterium]|nr:hypothetical protein [Spirochaetia bacterium]
MEQPAAATPFLDNQFKPYGKVAAIRVKAAHPKFEEAWQITVSEKPKQSWEAGLLSVTSEAISEKDVLFISFYARAKDTDGGVLELDFRKNSPPWSSSLTKAFKLSSDWSPFVVAFRAATSFAQGDAKLTLITGGKEQELQIARVVFINAGSSANIEDLLRAGAK